MDAKIKAEWHHLRKVVVHRPGIEMYLGLLEPYGSLYERAFSRYDARREHERLEYTLKHEFKVDVIRLKDKILEEADKKPDLRKQLIEKAHESIKFQGNTKEVSLAKQELEKNAKVLDSGHFFNTFLLHPNIDLEVGKGTRTIHLNITEKEPVSNLYFMRDQQAVTDKGIFLSRMSKPQRRREPLITNFLWNQLGLNVVHETQSPGTFEGGDFIPMGEFALVGIGDRTNRSGINQMLKYGLDFDEVGVVHQPNHPLIPGDQKDPMVDMHLDTYFNVASSNVVVGLDLLLKQANVEIYHKKSKGEYQKEKDEPTLHDFIKEKGFDIINITTLEQMSYASNFLCIKDGSILAVEVDRVVKDVIENLKTRAKNDPKRYGKLLNQAEKDYNYLKNEGQFFPHKKEIYQHGIDAYPLVLENLTGGYGGAHCMTCALRRG
jgi:arginine deiminase